MRKNHTGHQIMALALCLLTVAGAIPAKAAEQPYQVAATETEETKTTEESALAEETTASPEAETASNAAEIYVPKLPDGVTGTSAATIQEAISMLPDGGTIIIADDPQEAKDKIYTEPVTIDGIDLTIKSHSAIHTIMQSGEISDGESLITVKNGGSLTLENAHVRFNDKKGGRTITLENGAKLILNEGSDVDNDNANSYGAIFADASSITVNGGSVSGSTINNTDVKLQEYSKNGKTAKRPVYDPEKRGNQPLGGAILMVNGSSLEMTSGSIHKNAAAIGGAIYASDLGAMTLSGGNIRDNTTLNITGVHQYGGAICVEDTSNKTITASGTKFSTNSSTNGGCFAFGPGNDHVTLLVTDGSFVDNHATNDGAVICSEASNLSIQLTGKDVKMTKNDCKNGFGAIAYLDACSDKGATDTDTEIIVDSAFFSGNKAEKSGLFHVSTDKRSVDVRFTGASFAKNKSVAGGGGVLRLASPDSVLFVDRCVFTNNSAFNRGGVFCVTEEAVNAKITLQNSSFSKNSSTSVNSGGGAFNGCPSNAVILVKDCLFDSNTCGVAESVGGGGALQFPAEGTNASITIDGGTFTNNYSMTKGGAVRAALNNSTLTVQGGALFQNNTAKLNGGAMHVATTEGTDYTGTVNLNECDILDNVCVGDFTGVAEEDINARQHYNAGGVYIGEQITLNLFDALVTGNYVDGGFSGNTVGAGIALCPNSSATFEPKDGVMIYGNGKGKGMDILIVPEDGKVERKTMPKVIISGTAPDGEKYNWIGLDGASIRTGEYNWDSVLSGVKTTGYAGEDNLDPVGFKTGLVPKEGSYKVRITGNYSKNAGYGAGGIMVNGKLIAGNGELSEEPNSPVTPSETTTQEQTTWQETTTEEQSTQDTTTTEKEPTSEEEEESATETEEETATRETGDFTHASDTKTSDQLGGSSVLALCSLIAASAFVLCFIFEKKKKVQ